MNSTIHKIYFATILVAYPLDQEFTYSFKADQMIKVGSIVQVPFRNKDYIGVVRSIQDKANFDVIQLGTVLKSFEHYDKIKNAWNDHSVAIKKFGRYPHRNIILNRKSTFEEEEFLKQPNSSW